MAALGYAMHGREIAADFARRRFADQLALIRSDLNAEFWCLDARVIGGSYGAYLVLHTLADMSITQAAVIDQILTHHRTRTVAGARPGARRARSSGIEPPPGDDDRSRGRLDDS